MFFYAAARPKCAQCSVTNRTYSFRRFQNCYSNPPLARSCSSPVFAYCYWASNNTGIL